MRDRLGAETRVKVEVKPQERIERVYLLWRSRIPGTI